MSAQCVKFSDNCSFFLLRPPDDPPADAPQEPRRGLHEPPDQGPRPQGRDPGPQAGQEHRDPHHPDPGVPGHPRRRLLEPVSRGGRGHRLVRQHHRVRNKDGERAAALHLRSLLILDEFSLRRHVWLIIFIMVIYFS